LARYFPNATRDVLQLNGSYDVCRARGYFSSDGSSDFCSFLFSLTRQSKIDGQHSAAGADNTADKTSKGSCNFAFCGRSNECSRKAVERENCDCERNPDRNTDKDISNDGVDGPLVASTCQTGVSKNHQEREPSMSEITTIGLDLTAR
jgi:hypothetical protein